MNITSLELHDFKNTKRAFDLSGLDVFTGPNGSGKTAIRQALQFALRGSTDLGAKPESTFLLSGVHGCAVTLGFSDDFGFVRRLVAKHDKAGTVKLTTELDINGRDPIKTTIADGMIRERLGYFSPMLQLSEFTSLSDDKKKDFILSLCGRAQSDEIDALTLLTDIGLAYLQRLPGIDVETWSRAKYDTLLMDLPADKRNTMCSNIVAELGKADIATYDSLLTSIAKEIKGELSESIGAALSRVREMSRSSRAEHDRARKAIEAMTEQKATIEVPARTAGQLEKTIIDLNLQRDDLIKDIAGKDATLNEYNRLTRQVEACATRISERETTINTITAAREECHALAESITVKIAKHSETQANDGDLLEIKRKTADEYKQCSNEYDDAHAAALRLKNQRIAAVQTLIALPKFDTDENIISLGMAERLELSMNAHNPPIKTMDLLRELIAHLKTLIDFDPVAVKKQHADSTEKIKNIDTELKTKENLTDTIGDKIAQLETANEENETKLSEFQVWKDTLFALTKSLGTQNQEINNSDDRITLQREEIKRYTEDKAAAEKLLSENIASVSAADVEALRGHQDELEAQIEKAKQALKLRQRYKTIELEILKTIESAEQHERLHTAAKLMVKAMQTLREQLMSKMIAPLLDRMNNFLAGSGIAFRAYCNLLRGEKPVFHLGWSDAEKRVPMESLSGGESALFCAALLYAMVAMNENLPLRLLVLEVGETDAVYLQAILDGLRHVSDNLSNAIVLTHDYSTTVVNDNWKIHQLK